MSKRKKPIIDSDSESLSGSESDDVDEVWTFLTQQIDLKSFKISRSWILRLKKSPE